MEVTTEHQPIAEFDPYTPEQHFIRAHRQDKDKESIAGQRYLNSTKVPDLDEQATAITGSATLGSDSRKDTVYDGTQKVTVDLGHTEQLDTYRRHPDSGEIEFCDLHPRKDTRPPVVVTLDTPPDSARTQPPMTERRHVTITESKGLPVESSLSAANGRSSGARTRTEYHESDMRYKGSVDRSTRTRHSKERDLMKVHPNSDLEESELDNDMRSRSPERSFRKRPVGLRLSYSRSPSIDTTALGTLNGKEHVSKKSSALKDDTDTDREYLLRRQKGSPEIDSEGEYDRDQ